MTVIQGVDMREIQDIEGMIEMKQENIKFFDYSKNLTNPVQGWATAKVAREVKTEGKAYRVEFRAPNEEQRFWWSGGRHACLSLAKELRFNKYEVTLTNPEGKQVNIASERY